MTQLYLPQQQHGVSFSKYYFNNYSGVLLECSGIITANKYNHQIQLNIMKYLCVILKQLGKVAALPFLSVIAFQLV